MKQWAYCIFVAIVSIFFSQWIVYTKEYGERLKALRAECYVVMQMLREDRLDEYDRSGKANIVVYDQTAKRYLMRLRRSGENVNDDELVRVARGMKPEQIAFEHVPDMEGTSHVIAIFKIEEDDRVCVGFIDT